MDYLADLTVKESCSILEQTTPTKYGGTASGRSAVFFAARRRRGEDETGTSRRTGRMGEDFERKKDELEGGQRDSEQKETKTLNREKQGFREDENGTLRRTKTGL